MIAPPKVSIYRRFFFSVKVPISLNKISGQFSTEGRVKIADDILPTRSPILDMDFHGTLEVSVTSSAAGGLWIIGCHSSRGQNA